MMTYDAKKSHIKAHEVFSEAFKAQKAMGELEDIDSGEAEEVIYQVAVEAGKETE